MSVTESGTAMIGQRIRALRIKHKKSQRELAEHLGVKRPTVTRIESGAVQVTAERLSIIAHFFDVHPGNLYPSLDPSTPTPDAADPARAEVAP